MGRMEKLRPLQGHIESFIMKIKLAIVGIVAAAICISSDRPADAAATTVNVDNSDIETPVYGDSYNPNKICSIEDKQFNGDMLKQLTDCLNEEREWFKL